MQIKAKIVSCHTAYSKRVIQEVNGTVILPPLVFSALIWQGRLSTVNLLIKVVCFVSKVNIKMTWLKLVRARRSTVLRLPLQEGFPVFIVGLRSEKKGNGQLTK